MKIRAFDFSVRIAAALGLLATVSVAPMRAQTVAYPTVKQVGNQNFSGNLGLDFTVNNAVLVTELGVFDSNGAVTAGTTLTVGIFNVTTQKLVAGPVTFTHANRGNQTAGETFLLLTPAVLLPPGNYSVVAVGFNANDPDGNTTIASPPITPSSPNTGGGAITYTGARYDTNTTLDLPPATSLPPNVFLAGNFGFTTTPVPADALVSSVPDLTAGTYPEFLVVDKFNTSHDSFAVANWGSANVSVFLGTGSKTFTGPTNYNTGNYPRSIAVADLCGHNRRDMAVANWMDGTVSILCNTGGGTFTPAAPTVAPAYAAGPMPYSVGAGDFNRDGNTDLIVADDNVGLTLLLGDGDGTFQSGPVIVDPNLAPSSVTVADFNNDGNLDIAMANPKLGTISVMLGDGHGNFGAAIPTTIGTISRPLFITAGKFKESSPYPDLVVTDVYQYGHVYILTGNGNGTFVVQAPLAVDYYPNSVAVGDLNGDGHQDLVVSNMLALDLDVFLGNGDGTFRSEVPFANPTMWEPVSAGLGIFDESAKSLDLALANFYGPINILFGEKLTISKVSGDVQVGSPNKAFPKPVVAKVSVAQSGLPVTFNIVAGGSGGSATFTGGVTSVTVQTDTTGTATSPTFTANGVVGSFTIVTTVGYASSTVPGGTVTFSEAN